MIQTIPDWDKQIFYAVNGSRNGFFDVLMPIFSLTWLLWLLCLSAFFLWGVYALRQKDRRRHLRPLLFGMALMIATSAVTDRVTNAAKDGVGRLRPFQSLPFAYYQSKSGWRQNPAVFTPSKRRADSFFSGHASHSMVVAVTAATLCPPLSPVVYAIPLVVGYSRIYLGRHYPSDVLCGWAAGACIALAARRLTRKTREKLRPKEDDS